ncbi:hypothetical protein MMC22_010453 [Lobaria immixta]|nr:hypothetical protein [Lobaria immixta]
MSITRSHQDGFALLSHVMAQGMPTPQSAERNVGPDDKYQRGILKGSLKGSIKLHRTETRRRQLSNVWVHNDS